MIDEKICKEFREQAMKLTKGMKGRTGELVAALSGYYYERREQVRQWLSLADLLESVFSDGIEPIYLAVHGREIADKAVKVARRIFESPYSMSVYRRSFHAQDWREYAPALVELMDGAYYPWGAWYAELGKSGNRLCEEGVCSTLLSEFLAMEINEGNAAVIGFVRNACLADNNVQVLTHAILLSVVKCSHVDLHRLLGDLLLAAKLQEGLRQSILENADMGSVDVLRMLMQIVHDNDLLRFSAALRALGTWMGLGYGFEDKRQAAKALRLGLVYLEDAQARTKALTSDDALEAYVALWAAATGEVSATQAAIETLLTGKTYQKLLALYFADQTGSQNLKVATAMAALQDDNLDVLAYAVNNLSGIHYGWCRSYESFKKNCIENSPADPAIRRRLFDSLTALLPRLPKKEHAVAGKPFEWAGCSLKQESVVKILMTLCGCDNDKNQIETLRTNLVMGDSYDRCRYIDIHLNPPKDDADRAYMLTLLKDKSVPVRTKTLEVMAKLVGTPEELDVVAKMLNLKTGELRQHAIDFIFGAQHADALDTTRKLLADKSEHRRLAGLNILDKMRKAESIDQSIVADCIALMPKVTQPEQILIDELKSSADRSKYTKANGFGLYDVNYFPEFAPLEKVERHNAKTVFGFSVDRIKTIFTGLCNIIEANKDFTYDAEKRWDSGVDTIVLGTSGYLRYPINKKGSQRYTLDEYVLPEVWRAWLTDNKVTCAELAVLKFMDAMERWSGGYSPNYQPWVVKILNKHLAAKKINELSLFCEACSFGELAKNILTGLLWYEFSAKERFDVISGVLADLFDIVPEKDWGRSVKPDKKKKADIDWDDDDIDLDDFDDDDDEGEKFAQIDEIEFLHNCMTDKAKDEDDARFIAYLGVGFRRAKLCDYFFLNLGPYDLARGVRMGVLREDAILRAVMCSGQRYIRQFARKMDSEQTEDNAEDRLLLKKLSERAAERIIEIELVRGDAQTEVSSLASEISRLEGAENLVRILLAIGDAPFYRGWNSFETKNQVLSGLLKVSQPAPDDNVETLRKAIDGRIAEKRLLEAAMFAPAWLRIVADLLDWQGLHCAAWYFHAHVNDTFSAEKETEVARYSTITPQEFKDGAFDPDWFHTAYSELGQERFDILYDCAKYIGEGATHRRAQRFSDATLGKCDLDELAAEITAKRQKDKLLSYSLVPLKRDKLQDTLARYEFIQEFLRQSKQFGAQRQETEKTASAIALSNLARTAGFQDVTRFSWRMECLKIETIVDWFKPRACEDIQLHIQFEGGTPELVLQKDGKTLKSIPARLKKAEAIVEGRQIVADLKAQHSRARASLEQAMVNCDSFELGELRQLMVHPVIAPLLQNIVFVSDQRIAFLEQCADAKDDEKLRIAHPYDLYTSNRWRDFQKIAFEKQIVQPFKQIFRELYLLNADEAAEKTVSRRYAGHQVQPKKTVALLKTRGWTVDYEEGLQRVYHREGIIAKMYAAADWFSPADIEAPTLETIRFLDKKTHEPLALADIPPVLFSEVMRDIDLVVSIAHVGGVDPEASHSTIDMRAAIIRELLVMLKIANVRIEPKHAHIQGTLGEYTVHLGSAIVHQQGRGAINILAVQSQHRGRIFLPFADEDPRTAEILSKILLLADDGSIKDTAILAQIR